MTSKTIHNWYIWLTEDRLSRWNHLRERSGQDLLNQDQGARVLANMSVYEQSTLNEIKERIAE